MPDNPQGRQQDPVLHFMLHAAAPGRGHVIGNGVQCGMVGPE